MAKRITHIAKSELKELMFFGNYEPVFCSRKQLLKSIIGFKKEKQNEK